MARSTAIIPTVAPWTNKDSSSTHGSKLYNMYVSKDAAGQFHAVKRPGLDYSTDYNPTPGTYTNSSIGNGAGLGGDVGSSGTYMFQIWGDELFTQNGASAVASIGTIAGSSPTTRKYYAHISGFTYLITTSTSITSNLYRFNASGLTQITNGAFPDSSGFPTKNSETLAGGMQVVDNYLCVLTKTGKLWNSAVGAPTTWSVLDYVSAEQDNDLGVYLSKHHNHLVVLGAHSTEFFYNASLPTGSPFLPRKDVKSSTGCASAESVGEFEDLTFFVAQSKKGDRYIAQIENFQISRISDENIERRLLGGRSAALSEKLRGTCVKVAGQLFYILTGTDNADGTSRVTFAYHVTLKQWYQWALASGAAVEIVESFDGSAQVGFTDESGRQYIQTKDYVYEISPVFTRDETTDGATDTITCKVTLPEWTGEPHEMGRSKFVRQLKLLCDESTDLSDTVQIEVSSDNFTTWTSLGSIPRNMLSKITQLGKFYRLAIRLTHAYNSTFRAQAFHLEYDAGI